MPKGFTRAAVSTSEDKNALRSTLALNTYYCLCGEFILVIDKPLSLMPRRRTDASYIVANQALPSAPSVIPRAYKLSAKPETAPLIVKVEDGFEKRWRFRCPRCELEVGYEAGIGAAKKGPCTYFLHGALTERQASAPEGALDEDPAAVVFAQMREQAIR